MSRFAKRFAELKAQEKKAFIPFTLLGFPNVEASKGILKTLIDAKPAALELGFPFSDPVADGPVIQAAVTETLANGYKLPHAFESIAYARSLDADIPIGVLVYYNTILSEGAENFFQQLKNAGADACLIADLPPEEAEEVKPSADLAGIELIFIVSPLTSADRFTSFSQYAGAFLYVVSRLGITGTEERYDSRLQELIGTIRQHSDLPLCVGFGISTPEHIQQMKAVGFDGMITGSRIIQVIQAEAKGDGTLAEYLATMTQAV
ncbi:MAG: tryptophan synthase subunit alpha [Vampirovibrionales bacterium]